MYDFLLLFRKGLRIFDNLFLYDERPEKKIGKN